MQEALRAATATLDARDRLRLRYYYAQGLTLAETGRLLHEHEGSVSRRLSAARKALRRDIERRLRHAGLDADGVARCFESVSEDAGPMDLDSMLDDAARNPDRSVQSTEASTAGGSLLATRKEG
jgi:hypothetical protein